MVCVPLRKVGAGEELSISYQRHFLCMSLQKFTWKPFSGTSLKRRKVPTQNKENDLKQNPANQFTRLGVSSRLRMFFPEVKI